MVSRNEIVASLQGEPLTAVLARVRQWPPRKLVSPLIACLYGDGIVKWRAVSALGTVAEALAADSLEAARTVIRRLMWSLNDESGAIGWGAPEAIAEILANHDGLAAEFGPLLAAYLRPEGLYLEPPPLQRGLLWGMGRLAGLKPHLLREWEASVCLPPYLDSPDPETRGLTARVLGMLGVATVRERLMALKDDPASFSLYTDGILIPVTVGSLVGEALARVAPCLPCNREEMIF